MSKDTESKSFLDAMGDVEPLKSEERVPLDKTSTKQSIDKTSQAARRRAAVSEAIAHNDPLVSAEVTPLEANAILAFQRPGVQHGVYRQLRLGKYSIDARLDLHRLTVEQARLQVYQFVRDCMAHDVRCALVTHGKGEGRANPAVLKSHLAHWLPQIKDVLAFHSAQKYHGGTGATYIMLKKSEKKRQENLERHR